MDARIAVAGSVRERSEEKEVQRVGFPYLFSSRRDDGPGTSPDISLLSENRAGCGVRGIGGRAEILYAHTLR